MPSGGGESTTTTTAEPWGPAEPFLEGILNKANARYQNGNFSPDPYEGRLVAGQSGATRGAYDAIMGMGADAGLPMGSLRGLAKHGDPRLDSLISGKSIYADLGRVKKEALGSAVPAAASMFSGNGMTDSSAAMDTVGRAATQAVAPIEYGAWQGAQDRRLSAIGQDNSTRLGAMGMMPEFLKAGYLPSMMMQQAGAGRDAHRQSVADARRGRYYEREGQGRNNFLGYSDLISQIAGMGGTQTSTGPSGQPGGLESAAGAAMGGLGAYGSMAAMGMGGPLGIGVGGLAALMGLL
jgi:hypothetical protein